MEFVLRELETYFFSLLRELETYFIIFYKHILFPIKKDCIHSPLESMVAHPL